METRTRRKFTREFKQEAVKLITEQHYSTSEAARNLGVGANLLRRWRQQLEAEAAGTRLSPDEREELARLRREVKTLRQEREILKRRQPSSPKSQGEIPFRGGGEGELPTDSSLPDNESIPKRFLLLD